MPNEPWWGWVLLGRLHPFIVHFPIGLIVAGALHEVVRWGRGRPVPSDVGSFCLALGLLSGGLAVWFGTLNASHQNITGDSARILEWHRYAGWALLMVGATAFLAGRVARIRPRSGAVPVYTGLMAVAAVCVGVSGHFGGQLVYGSTYITSVLPWAASGESASAAIVAEPDVIPVPTQPASEPIHPLVTPGPASTPPEAAAADPEPVPAPEPSRDATSPHVETQVADDTAQVARGPIAVEPSLEAAAVQVAPAMTRIDFARDVRPILEATCVECHGPDKVKARLRMDSIAGLQQGGKSGPLVVPGDPEASLIMRRVLGLDDEDQMPLDNDPLTPSQLDILRRWIAEGALYTSRTGTDSQP